MEELQKAGENKIKSVASGEEVLLKSLWEDQDCVITFFRRWGCGFCRLAAKDLSRIKPLLDIKHVRLIGIGVEELGLEDFQKGNFFNGDLFVDTEKKCYTDFGYKSLNLPGFDLGSEGSETGVLTTMLSRTITFPIDILYEINATNYSMSFEENMKKYNVLTIVPALVVKTSRDAISRGKTENVGGDMKGDKYQVGGTLVISKGGKEVLLNHKQESLADHVHPSEILKSLGIEDAKLSSSEAPAATCDSTCEASG